MCGVVWRGQILSIRTGQPNWKRDEGGPERRTDECLSASWRLPDSSEPGVEGRVELPADGLIWLDLRSDPWQAIASGEHPAGPRILFGEAAGGAPVTLYGARFLGGERALFGGEALVRYLADSVITGVHAESEEEISLPSIRVSFRGLREWLMGWTQDTSIPLPVVRPSTDPEEAETTSKEEWLRALSFDIDAVRVSAFVGKTPARTGRFHTVYEARAWLQLATDEPMSLVEWRRRWIEPLRDLVLFGTREQTIVLSLSAPPSEPGARNVKVYKAPDVSISPPDHVEYHQRDLLPAGIWGEDGFAALITNWRGLHEQLGPVGQAMFEVWNTVDMPPLTRLLRLTSCAEGYHRALHDEPPFTPQVHDELVEAMLSSLPDDKETRSHYRARLRHANSQSQRARIRWLINRIVEIDSRLVGQGAALTSRLVDWRNDHTHLDGEITAPPLDDLLLLNAVLTYVLEANVLLDLGLAEDTRYCLACGHVWDDPIPTWLDSISHRESLR